MAVVWAILRAQWLSMRMGANRRGTILSLITGAVWYGLWIVVASFIFFRLSGAEAGQLRVWLPIGMPASAIMLQACLTRGVTSFG